MIKGHFLKHKFGAKRTQASTGRTYSSKIEAKYAERLELLKASGELLFYLEQVNFHLPGGINFRPDFMEFYASGEVVVTEVKGLETDAWKVRRKLFEATYPITLNVVKKVK